MNKKASLKNKGININSTSIETDTTLIIDDSSPSKKMHLEVFSVEGILNKKLNPLKIQANTDTVLVLVGEDLTVENPNDIQQLITVDQGDIGLDANVGSEIAYTASEAQIGREIVHQTDPNVEGVFVANGNLTIASQSPTQRDKKFIGASTFVGWSGVNLNRNFEDSTIGAVLNSWSPTESFIYRPDFVVNSPFETSTTQFEWREVEPQEF